MEADYSVKHSTDCQRSHRPPTSSRWCADVDFITGPAPTPSSGSSTETTLDLFSPLLPKFLARPSLFSKFSSSSTSTSSATSSPHPQHTEPNMTSTTVTTPGRRPSLAASVSSSTNSVGAMSKTGVTRPRGLTASLGSFFKGNRLLKRKDSDSGEPVDSRVETPTSPGLGLTPNEIVLPSPPYTSSPLSNDQSSFFPPILPRGSGVPTGRQDDGNLRAENECVDGDRSHHEGGDDVSSSSAAGGGGAGADENFDLGTGGERGSGFSSRRGSESSNEDRRGRIPATLDHNEDEQEQEESDSESEAEEEGQSDLNESNQVLVSTSLVHEASSETVSPRSASVATADSALNSSVNALSSPLHSNISLSVPSRPSSPHLHDRRLTRNIDGLSLGGLARISPPLPSPPPPPTILSTIPQASSSTSTDVPPPAIAISTAAPVDLSSTARRLHTLPRLLSSHGYSPDEDHTDGEETETETEAETETEGDDSSGEEASAHPPTTSATTNGTLSVSPARATPRFGFANLAMSSSSAVAPSAASLSPWTTFDPMTPTPGPLRTTRPTAEAVTSQSYFDIPPRARPARTPAAAVAAGAPLMSPLIPMSMSNTAKGKRPTPQYETGDEGGAPLFTANSARGGSTSGHAAPTVRARRHSFIHPLSPSLIDEDDQALGTAGLTLDPVWHREAGLPTPGPSFLVQPSTAAPPSIDAVVAQTPALPRQQSSFAPRLNRPRSMYELHVAPPAYHAVYTRAGLGPKQIVFPREEEGKEGLPGYTCAVHIEAYMPRKVEFTAPSVQARDRGWKKQYVVLHGTSIKIFKHDLRTHPIQGEDDWSIIPAEIAGADGPPPLHFHVGEYGAPPSVSSGSTKVGGHETPNSQTSSKFHIAKSHLPGVAAPGTNYLIKNYSLQNAESGLAADYIKRKHVVRVRAEGEQFLLQVNDDRSVIDLIEALQAATNVALDLDARPLPKFITLPRRRRRRPRAPVVEPGAAPESAPTEAVANRQDENRLGDMLAEEQHHYAAARGDPTVM